MSIKTIGEVIQTPTKVTCFRCKLEFDAIAMQLEEYGTLMFPRLCKPCFVEREAEEKERLINEARERFEKRWNGLCPKQYRLKSESDGETDLTKLSDSQPKLCDVLSWGYQSRGLVIRGSTGKGKTRSVWRLLRKQFCAGKGIVAVTAAEFDRQCRDAGGKFTLTEWFDGLADVDLLFLDDLGKANWTLATEAQWFDLVEHRTRAGKPVIITTNDDGDSLAARMTQDRGEPLIRRLRDYCDCIVFV